MYRTGFRRQPTDDFPDQKASTPSYIGTARGAAERSNDLHPTRAPNAGKMLAS
jgi:hypothetical protein